MSLNLEKVILNRFKARMGHVRSIVLNLSGGADSALALYMITNCATAEMIDMKLHTYHFYNPAFPVDTKAICENIIDYVEERNPGIEIIRHYFECEEVGEAKRQIMIDQYLADKEAGLVDWLFTGTTMQPSDDVMEMLGMEPLATPRTTPKDNDFLFTMNKRDVAEMYKLYKLNDLFEMTFSCVSPNDAGEPCGECWWCKERNWAFYL